MEYIAVRINTLKASVKLGFDLYIKLPSSRYVRYVDKKLDIDDEQKKSLKSKKVRKLYILESEEDNYLQYLDRCLGATVSDASLSKDQKAEVMTSISKDLSRQIYDKGVDEKNYKNMQKAGVALMDLLDSDESMLGEIFKMKQSEDEKDYLDRILNHSINTSSLCVAFAKDLGLSKESIENLSTAGLLHDLSIMKYEGEEKALFFKDIETMAPADLTKYKQHPQKTIEMISDKPFVSKEVADLIITHEEKVSGDGFPNKITKMTQEQEVHSLCCFFERQLSCLGWKVEDAIEDLMVGQLGNYDMNLLKKFKAFAKKNFGAA